MTPNQVIENIETIRESNLENLMARHFDADYFYSLDGPLRQQLTRIIAPGIENPDSQMGAYAMDPKDYDRFAPCWIR